MRAATTYALFDVPDTAAEAIRSLRRESPPADHLRVAVLRGEVDSETLPVARTNARHRAGWAAVSGLALGVGVGGLLLVTGVADGGTGMTLGLTGLLGAALGALGGALSGVGSPNPALEQLEHRLSPEHVVLVVETDNRDELDRAIRVLAAHGGLILPA